jgi:hypothetical protein
MYLERPPQDDQAPFLTDWPNATPGYHLVALSSPDLRLATGHTIDNATPIEFSGTP